MIAPPTEWKVTAGGRSRVILEGEQFCIGKIPGCDFLLDAPVISRRHLKLEVRGGKVFALDLGSTNGSTYCGSPLPPQNEIALNLPSEILLGGSEKIRIEKLTAPLTEEHKFRKAPPLDDKLAAAFGEAMVQIASVGDEIPGRERKLDHVLASEWAAPFTESEKSRLRREILEAGPITDLMADPAVTEIVANGPRSIWIEKNGSMLPVEGAFCSEQSLLAFLRRMLAPVGRTLDTRNPVVDARLPDGSRLCAVTAPAVLGGTHVSIRRFSSSWSQLEKLVESGSVGEAAARYLLDAVEKKKNILVSGSTGTGKTTLLNVIASRIPANERILTLEDTAELQILHPHVVRLESRPANLEGEGEITIRQLLRTALRLRPDRLVVGECRGAEALDLLQALNTGHAGSMSTIHANSSRDALGRLELLCLLGSGNSLQPAVARAYIASAVQVLVHLGRSSGKRSLESIEEIVGVDEGVVLLRRVYPCA